MDNSTWLGIESTAANVVQRRTGNFKIKLILNVSYTLISLIAIIGNSVAYRVITCSSSIRKCKSYILFINQCLMDGICGMFTVICVICEYTIRSRGMKNTTMDWIICSIIHSDILIGIPSCGAAYNLAAMSVERMISIQFPVFHRNRINNKVMLSIAICAWILGIILLLPLCIITNGINPNGNCYYWDSLGFHYRLQISIALNVYLSAIPFLVMLISYVVMFVRIAIMKLKVRLAVIKVLASCVFMFFFCHLPRNVFSILSLTTDKGLMWFRDPVYVVALVMVQFTAIMNPIVYVVQYQDYRKELFKQLRRAFNSVRLTSTPMGNSEIDSGKTS